jgi:transcriptional regulator GlxA family with amidase domain
MHNSGNHFNQVLETGTRRSARSYSSGFAPQEDGIGSPRFDSSTEDGQLRWESLQKSLRENYHRPVNIKEVAAGLSLSREHFSRVFKAGTGMTPARYLREIRLRAARQLLLETGMLIREVAAESGFASASQFCRRFRATFGQSPQEIRDGQ